MRPTPQAAESALHPAEVPSSPQPCPGLWSAPELCATLPTRLNTFCGHNRRGTDLPHMSPSVSHLGHFLCALAPPRGSVLRQSVHLPDSLRTQGFADDTWGNWRPVTRRLAQRSASPWDMMCPGCWCGQKSMPIDTGDLAAASSRLSSTLQLTEKASVTHRPSVLLNFQPMGQREDGGELCLGQEGLQLCQPGAEPAVQVTPSFCPPDPILQSSNFGIRFSRSLGKNP